MHDAKHDALSKLSPLARLMLIDRCVAESLTVDEVVRAAIGRGPWSPEAKAVAVDLAKAIKFEPLREAWPFDCACGAVAAKLEKCHSCGGPICFNCADPRGCPKCVAVQQEKIAQRRKESKSQ
jgi:hypothetical protein